MKPRQPVSGPLESPTGDDRLKRVPNPAGDEILARELEDEETQSNVTPLNQGGVFDFITDVT